MSTPNRGYTTPDPDDTPDVPFWVENLANGIDDDLGDAFGTSPVLASGTLALSSGSGACSWERVGRLVVVRFDNTRTVAVGVATIATGLPAAIRPVGGDAFGGGWLDGNYAGTAIVTSGGAVAVAHQTGASRARAQGTITYLVDIA
ncbi:hypothetical protein [Cellulosimicrobium sp. 22601]|uniref:hypothetical protein n=1 Tax=unclassified Cellulosimicrobium TaxID=2624466 RepID=UPI003F82F0A9